jgi:acetyl coenzyme A synthetase (ADP forming)-like protein
MSDVMSLATTDIHRGPAANRLLLRDGSVATVRPATPDDRDAVRRFYHDQSPESRRRRFMVFGEPPQNLIDRLCDSSDPTDAMTLVALRQLPDGVHVIAVCSYVSVNATTAEAAFAVDDHFHGRGIATLMLHRLAAIAADHGFRWFQATTLFENREMIDVFRDSGFDVRSKSADGVVDVRLSVTPSPDGVRAIDERDRIATVASLRSILEPTSIAVIGASRQPTHLGRRILDALHRDGFRGAVYPVNPHCDEIDGYHCYRSVKDLPAGVDLAVVAVPAAQVLAAVDDCGAAGVRSLLVITAGFAESGEAGRTRQRDLLEKARGYGMRLIGPNCMGIINTNDGVRMNASFAPTFPPRGRIALASQSGGLGLAILQLAAERRLGISTFVSLGNKADVSGNDLLQYSEDHAGTSTILLYLESFGNPRRFAQLARRIGRKKPIVAVKAGRTSAGSRAAGSHTAGLASSDVAVDALFRQSGVIRADTIDEMFDIATTLDVQPLPRGGRLAIITNAGGPAILAADACEAAGLTVSELAPPTREQLAAFLPAHSSLANPVDLVASAGPDEYRRAIAVALTAADTDALLVIYTQLDTGSAQPMLEAIAAGVTDARRAGASDKPVMLCTMDVRSLRGPLEAEVEQIPAFVFPENAIRALGKIAAYARWRSEPAGLVWGFDDTHPDEARALCREIVAARGESWLTPEELTRVLNAFGLPMVPTPAARSEEEAVAVAVLIGFPVVLKISSPKVLHKTEAGGVIVNLTTEAAVRAAFRQLAAKVPDAVSPGAGGTIVVQPMITNGIETLIGVTVDPLFGPLVAFGLGGVQVEVLRDVAFRIAPLTDRDAEDLINGIRGSALLRGYRGRPAMDVEALRDVLLRVSAMSIGVPEIQELDLNPVIALPTGHGCRIVDARIKVG